MLILLVDSDKSRDKNGFIRKSCLQGVYEEFEGFFNGIIRI